MAGLIALQPIRRTSGLANAFVNPSRSEVGTRLSRRSALLWVPWDQSSASLELESQKDVGLAVPEQLKTFVEKIRCLRALEAIG
jgi:hypothetical protein